MIRLAGWQVTVRSWLLPLRALREEWRRNDGELMRLQGDSIAGYEQTIPMLTQRLRAAEQRSAELEADLAVAQMETSLARETVPSSDRQIRIAEFVTALADAESVADIGREEDEEITALWRAIVPARYLILEHPK